MVTFCHRLVSVCCTSSTTSRPAWSLAGLDEFVKLLWWGIFLQLKIVSKRVVKDGAVVDDIIEECCIQNKENRSWNRSLLDSTTDEILGRASDFVSYSLSNITVHAKNVFKTLEGSLCQRQLIGPAELDTFPWLREYRSLSQCCVHVLSLIHI